ncbi:hypothetical protein DOTSEDRAFT_72460 [Dothistroma septosporum NZE10]|uniref:FAD-binding domain-containing protein n=1 Tax=Dothistroma septosporum (strain NZE10 / CBS 128990) TaxID=675120 RepID=M2Y464_DOTSN|nr:hypothetical protein DOTSEDRAFT_72460 [Dothistroma septosporum NZE10]
MAPFNILINGCSVAGPALAIFLLMTPLPADQRPRITILERSPALRTNGQNVDIRGTGVTIIRKLGLEPVIRASSTGEEGVQWVDGKNQVWACFAVDKSGKTQGPTADIEIMRGRLAEIMYDRSKQQSAEVQQSGGAGIQYIFGDYLDSIDQHGDRVNVHFAKSDEHRSYDLVVGADGLQSSTRKLMWGADGESDRMKQLDAFGAFFSMPPGETDTMWRRWYHAPGRRGIMVRPDKHRGKSTVLMTIVNDKDERLSEVSRQGSFAQKALMKEYFEGCGWESERMLKEMDATDDFYYDIIAQVHMQKWSKGRVVLLGDAGYCASPFSGMGTTLALNGAYNLAGALAKHPFNHEAAFAEYDMTMRPIVDKAQKLVPGMPHILHPETAWGLWLTLVIGYILTWTNLQKLIFMLKGPSANAVPMEDFGFAEAVDTQH